MCEWERWKGMWFSPWKLPPSGPWGYYIWGGRGAWLEMQEDAETSQTAASLHPGSRTGWGGWVKTSLFVSAQRKQQEAIKLPTLLSMLTWSEGHGEESLSHSKALSRDWEMSNSSAGQGGARRSEETSRGGKKRKHAKKRQDTHITKKIFSNGTLLY